MKLLLKKEIFLAASPLSYIFLVASFMTLLPGYPILVGAFFICFGIFHSFQATRETNDTLFTVLLPVKKTDIVGAKFAFTCLIQMIGFAICSALTVLRMTALSGSAPYVGNAMMNASPVYLAFVLLIFTSFNVIFVGGFFKTGYKIGMPYLLFGVAVLVLIAVGETLHHIPGLEFLNVPSGEKIPLQLAALAVAALIYAGVTALACGAAKRRFERIAL